MKSWKDERGFLSKDYSLDEVKKHYQEQLEQEKTKLFKNFREGEDFIVYHEGESQKMTYVLISLKAKNFYFGDSIIEGMEYKLEESPEGFSTQIASPVFRVGQPSKFGNESKIEWVDDGKNTRIAENFGYQTEIENQKKKLEQEAQELEKKAKKIRQQKAELENFTHCQHFPPKK